MDQIHAHEQIPETSSCSNEYNRDFFVLFVDYKQARDSVIREQLWVATGILRVPIELITLIISCIHNFKPNIKLHISKDFNVKRD